MSPGAATGGDALFAMRDLRVTFGRGDARLQAVRGVDLELKRGEVLGVVGESGSGKSVTMLASLGLEPAGAEVSGSVRFEGREILGLKRSELRRIRGRRIAMIFQDPLSALNPVLRVGDQVAEAVLLHHPGLSRRAARARAVELLDLVAIPEPERRARAYPHEFSGGMRQRAMIAMAVANDPDILIADEPTTALDVTVQAQILGVLQRLRERLGCALVLITHDLGVVAGHADRVAVMYAGRVVESADVSTLFADPRHPYTRGLLASIPDIARQRDRLFSIKGVPPALGRFPEGCAFHPRCRDAQARCRVEDPRLRPVLGRLAACHVAEDLVRFSAMPAEVPA